MTEIVIIKSAEGQFQLSGILDQKTVSKVWPQRAQLKSDKKLVIDLAGVTHSDSAGLAFLTCIQSDAIKSQQSLSFINIPHQLQQLIELSRLEDVLNTELCL
ncbi:MAG: STAS domain-containing protein [Gammaproteobacteria bacterium]|nr:STAS domain-containing protein [Gammaproteobacteria bacterium]